MKIFELWFSKKFLILFCVHAKKEQSNTICVFFVYILLKMLNVCKNKTYNCAPCVNIKRYRMTLLVVRMPHMKGRPFCMSIFRELQNENVTFVVNIILLV